MKRMLFIFMFAYFGLFTLYFTIGFFNVSFAINGLSIFDMIVLESSYLTIAKEIIYIPLIPLIFIARNISLSNDLYEVFTLSIGIIAILFYNLKDS